MKILKRFEAFGKVIDLSMPHNHINIKKNKRFCSLTYANAEIANKVLKAKHVVMGRVLSVRSYNKAKLLSHNAFRTVFVGNLNRDTNERDILEHFDAFGKVIDLSMPHNAMDRTKNLGFCFVTHVNIEVTNEVLKAKHVINNMTLDVRRYDETKSKANSMLPRCLLQIWSIIRRGKSY